MNDDSHPSHAARDVDPTVLDHIRPTVVVRRRVWEPPPELRRPAAQEEPRSFEKNTESPTLESPSLAAATAHDDEAPPSSLFLAPESLAEYAAGAPLDDVFDDEAEPSSEAPSVTDMAVAPDPVTVVAPEPSSLRLVAETQPSPTLPVPACPTTRTVHVGEAIGLASLADAIGRTTGELVAELVTRGFFEVNARTALPRKVASAAARAFGWEIEPPEPEVAAPEESAVALRLVERRRPSEKPAAKPRAVRTPARAQAPARRTAKSTKKTATTAAAKRRKAAKRAA